MVLTPLRTQYPFDLKGVKSKSMSDIFRMRQQWEAFERVENYNDIIYQQLKLGNRSKPYYTFQSKDEINDYRNGQLLHISRYPDLPPSTFNSISERIMPDVYFYSPPPYETQSIKQNGTFSNAISSSEQTKIQNDNSIYMYVSSYNSAHQYKYIFPSNEEQLAYHRAEQRILTQR